MDDLPRARAAALVLGAVPHSVELQRDTFFCAPHGRLKLREIEGKPAYLIGYRRADACATRVSEYTLVSVPEPGAMRQALADTLGVWLCVRKRREILLWDHVRIHLDEVAGLGSFVEFEAVLTGPLGNPDQALGARRIADLCSAMAITREHEVAVAYADLLAQANA